MLQEIKKQSVFTPTIVPIRIPLQRNQSAPMASSKSTIHKRSGTHPPSLWRRYLEMVMATIDIELRTVTLLLCVSSCAEQCKRTETQLLSTKNRRLGLCKLTAHRGSLNKVHKPKEHQVQKGATLKNQSEHRPQTQMHWAQENGRRERKREEEGD